MLKFRNRVWKAAAKPSQGQIREANEGVAQLQWGDVGGSKEPTPPSPAAALPAYHATGIPELFEDTVYQDIDYIVIRKVQVAQLNQVFGNMTCMQFR
jgi:hypothetical protein